MTLDALRNCLQILSNWDEDVFYGKHLLEPREKIYSSFILPFKTELDFNLFNKNSELINELLDLYITSLRPFKDILSQHHSLIMNHKFIKLDEFWFDLTAEDVNHSIDVDLLLNANNFFISMFEILQNKCEKYGLDIFRLCDGSDFDDDRCSYLIKNSEVIQKNNLVNTTELEKEYLVDLINFRFSERNAPLLTPENALTYFFEQSNLKYFLGAIEPIYNEQLIKKNRYLLDREMSNNYQARKAKQRTNPQFKKEAIPTILKLLEIWFEEGHFKQLEKLLISGVLPTEKLLFLGNGKTLFDFFKQLMLGQFLNIAVQEDLEYWISNRFEYWKRSKNNEIKPKYASSIISGNERAADGNRIIDIQKINGEFEIIQLEIKNRDQKPRL